MIGINEEYKHNGFTIFPNPTNNLINLEVSEPIDADKMKIEIVDMLGKSVLTQELVLQKSLTIDVSQLSPAIHYLKISGKKDFETAKFVIIK